MFEFLSALDLMKYFCPDVWRATKLLYLFSSVQRCCNVQDCERMKQVTAGKELVFEVSQPWINNSQLLLASSSHREYLQKRWLITTLSIKCPHASDQLATFSNRDNTTSANTTANLQLADKHVSALLIKLDKSLPSVSSDVWMCAQPQGRVTGCTQPPLQGQNQVEVRNKRPFHLSYKQHQWEERRKLENAIQVLCDACRTTDRFPLNVARWQGTAVTLLVYISTCFWVYVLYTTSQ